MNESDRRKMERFDLKLPTKLSWTGRDNEQKSVELMTNNICAGGAYLLTDRPLSKGTEVEIDLILELDRLLELRGQQSHINVSGSVIRTDQRGMAVCFDREYNISPYKIIDI
ncbi:MAG: PilZ domain-containing protein [Desulfobacteraceae bacterium]|nr:PilZ domain-containing protein [Desulfobacteraceae bacterium]